MSNWYELYEKLRLKVSAILKKIPLDGDYTRVTAALGRVLRSNDDFNYVECTILVTEDKKGKLISVYNQASYKEWLNRIIELPSDWGLSKLFCGQMLYCRIYLDKYEYPRGWAAKDTTDLHKGYLYICVDHATAQEYTCECLKENEFVDDTLGLKPYKNIFFYNPFEKSFYVVAPEYYWRSTLCFCPICGTKTGYEEPTE